MSARIRRGRVLGLDVGGKRTGVAIADELGISASPVGFVTRGRNDVDELRAFVRRFNPDRIVAGLPANLSGLEGMQAAEVRSYAQVLADAVELPLEFWDERLTSAIAERMLIESGARRAKRKEQIDAVAAAVMLQSYLDAEEFKRQRGLGRG